jgi:tetratricopeptide (TPR) repeat protein
MGSADWQGIGGAERTGSTRESQHLAAAGPRAPMFYPSLPGVFSMPCGAASTVLAMDSPATDQGRFATLIKWLGIAAGLLSFATALYGVVRAQAELRVRERVVAEQLALASSQRAAGDYPAAWESLQRAGSASEPDGMLAKLLGGLSEKQQAVRTAQEDLAMEWIRGARAPEGHKFGETADKLVGVLAIGANNSEGSRKADLLAHVGWAYFLKVRDGDTGVRPDSQYQLGVAADATNPYANAFWGHFILWNNGALSAAKAHFAAALSSGRARTDVRQFQLAALSNSEAEEMQVEWWRVVNEMRKNGEPIDGHTRDVLLMRYGIALHDAGEMSALLSAAPPLDHVELLNALRAGTALDGGSKFTVTAALAVMLEAAGRKDESLAAWRNLLAETHGDRRYELHDRAEAAIARLGAGAARSR